MNQCRYDDSELNTPSKNLSNSDFQENDFGKDSSTLWYNSTIHFSMHIVNTGNTLNVYFELLVPNPSPEISFLVELIFLNCFKIGWIIPSSKPPPPSLLCTHVKLTDCSKIKITGLLLNFIFLFVTQQQKKSFRFYLQHISSRIHKIIIVDSVQCTVLCASISHTIVIQENVVRGAGFEWP